MSIEEMIYSDDIKPIKEYEDFDEFLDEHVYTTGVFDMDKWSDEDIYLRIVQYIKHLENKN